jgi:ABC-type transporter Mla subunit MlaD
MLGFLPTQESLRETTRNVIARLTPLYQTWTRPENKYPSLLSMAVGASLYLSGFGWLPMLWSMAGSLIGGHFGIRATQEAIVFYNRVKDIAEHIDVTVVNANNRFVALSDRMNARLTEAAPTIAATNVLLERMNARVAEAGPAIAHTNELLGKANAEFGPTLAGLNEVVAGVNARVAQAGSTFEATNALLGKANTEFEPTLTGLNEVVAGVNARVAQAGSTLEATNALLGKANAEFGPTLAGVNEVVAGVNARVAEAGSTIAHTNALLGKANGQIDPAFENLHSALLNLNETLSVVKSTAEYLDGGAQVTSTMLTPLSFTARALRATGNYMLGTNDAPAAVESPAESESKEEEALSQSGDYFPF